MIFSYDAFKRLDKPLTYLAKPDKKYIGIVESRELATDLCFNNISEISFKINKYENNTPTINYDEIDLLKLVEVSFIGWFQITDIATDGNGANEFKTITALSLENELTTKILTAFGSMGKESDTTGGLDRYCLCNISDAEHSILHIVLQKAPTWQIGFIDPEITTQYRTFNNDSVDAYSFLTGDVSKEFECIFQFDTFSKTISAYKLANIGQVTNIYLSFRNLVKQVNIQSNSSDIKTIMNVAGGDDRGSPLGIIEVNPNGNNYISDFSYYKPWMSQELQDKLTAYEIEFTSRVTQFTPALDYLQGLTEELSNIKNRVPTAEHSTTWSEYGLVELQTEFDYYTQKMSLYLNGSDETQRLTYYNILNGTGGIKEALTARQSEYDSKVTQISNQKVLCESYVLDLTTYLGADLYKELSTYTHYTDFVDDTFVVTDIMTDDEILLMRRDLLAMARTKLAEVCKPSYTMTVSAVNFTAIPEFITYSEQMYLGNMITVEYDNDICVESRLLKIHINWDDLTDFELTFSSKNRLDEGWAEFAEVQAQASSAANTQTINGTGWNNAKNKTNIVSQYMKSALDTSLQKLKNGSNEEFLIDNTGTKWRKWVDISNDYSPNQMWAVGNGLYLTENSWQTVSVALGELDLGGGIIKYGLAADMVMGNMLLGQTLNISNDNSSIIMNENGATFTNCDITVTKDKNTIKLNATDGFKITKDGVDNLYLDLDGNITFKGTLEGATGSFSGSITASSFVGGTIMSTNYLQRDVSGNLVYDGTGNTIETGLGIIFNMNTGYAKFTGTYDYAWLEESSGTHSQYIELDSGRMRMRDETRDCSMYYTSEGIATTSDANNASGVIDFRSNIYGSASTGNVYKGITVQTLGSPVALRSLENHVIINPSQKQAIVNPTDITIYNKFTFDIKNKYAETNGVIDYNTVSGTGDGILYFGTRTWDSTSSSYTYSSGLRFSADPTNPYLKVTKSNGTSLAPIYASNLLVGEDETTATSIKLQSIYVQNDVPTDAKEKDIWIDTDDYSRYDKTTITTNTTLLASDNEVIVASGTISITLHSATTSGIIKKIYNVGTGIITIIGTINNITNMYLYPNESVELITNGSGWVY